MYMCFCHKRKICLVSKDGLVSALRLIVSGIVNNIRASVELTLIQPQNKKNEALLLARICGMVIFFWRKSQLI